MLSDTAEYALRAAIHLATREADERFVRVDEIAAATRVPRNYLSKTLHVMAREGVLVSARGAQGGFRLARPAAETTVLSVVGLFDDVGPGRRCILGRPTCSDAHPCAAHHRWRPVSERIRDFFNRTSLDPLVNAELDRP